MAQAQGILLYTPYPAFFDRRGVLHPQQQVKASLQCQRQSRFKNALALSTSC
jgi:hypothetical protein